MISYTIDFKNILSEKDIYVSFNGDAFDIPYLNSKYEQNKLAFSIEKSANIDLLKVSRRVYPQLANYKLKTIEEILGIHRDDLITGKDSVDMYFKFLKNPSDELLDTILLHNFDDIKNLIHMCKLLGGMSGEDKSHFIPKYWVIDKTKYLVTELSIKNDFLLIKICTLEKVTNNHDFLKSGGHIISTTKNDKSYINIKIPLISGTLNTYNVQFIDVSTIGLNLNELDINVKLQYLVSANNILISDNINSILNKILLLLG
jgi:uncharacterized protein YprB with RNaseH-like and TPR domain